MVDLIGKLEKGSEKEKAALIKAFRETNELTQEDFAHEFGVTFATINRWENRKASPSRLALKRFKQMYKSYVQEHKGDDAEVQRRYIREVGRKN